MLDGPVDRKCFFHRPKSHIATYGKVFFKPIDPEHKTVSA